MDTIRDSEIKIKKISVFKPNFDNTVLDYLLYGIFAVRFLLDLVGYFFIFIETKSVSSDHVFLTP